MTFVWNKESRISKSFSYKVEDVTSLWKFVALFVEIVRGYFSLRASASLEYLLTPWSRVLLEKLASFRS
jgi:hypothetical protein